jgi:hypothetical protein
MTDVNLRHSDMRIPIDDKDYVFARFRSEKPGPASRRETLTIPGRAGTSASRVVQVVHMRSGAALQDRPRRVGAQARAATWDTVFTAAKAVPA